MQIVLLTSIKYTVQLSIFFSAQLALGFSVVQYFSFNREQVHRKKEDKVPVHSVYPESC